MHKTKIIFALSLTCILFVAGCTKEKETAKKKAQVPSKPPSAQDQLNTALKAVNPDYTNTAKTGKNRKGSISSIDLSNCGVTNISPLKGLPLTGVDISKNNISDISPLEGMQISQLFLNDTIVEDLSPIKGMPLTKLYIDNSKVTDLTPIKDIPLHTLSIKGTKITNLSPLKNMPLNFLWLNKSKVIDISPIANCPLVNLTLYKTKVEDISSLSQCKTLRILHIGHTLVKDISPIKDLQLTSLVYSTRIVTNGLETTKGMSTIQKLGTTLENRRKPSQFWKLYYKQ